MKLVAKYKVSHWQSILWVGHKIPSPKYRSNALSTNLPAMACKSPSRKLTDADVRSIFECLHHKAPIPPNLKFTIVPVGPSGQKFSPPSHEFEGTNAPVCTH
jgi:hypothetical protein